MSINYTNRKGQTYTLYKRMCSLSSIDGWLELEKTGPVAELAHELIPTLGTDQFYELW